MGNLTKGISNDRNGVKDCRHCYKHYCNHCENSGNAT